MGVQSSSDKVEVIDVATAQPRTVATIAEQQWVYALRWSVDGSKVAYSQSSASSSAQTLWVASVGPGISTTRIASNVREWDWSPDNKQFAYATNDNPNYVDVPLHIVNSDGSGDHVILQPASKEQTEPWYLKWSSDGSRIALDLRKRTEVPYEAAVLDVATSEWTTFADRQVVNGTEGWETCWTKDDASIFLRDVTDGEIFLTRAAGGSERSLTTQGVGTLRLSPDGKTLAWVKKTGELFVTDIATGRALQLDPGVQQTYLEWSPDSAYVVAKDAATGDYEVAGRDGRTKWRFHD
jgi:Tol biopolymer transport system component